MEVPAPQRTYRGHRFAGDNMDDWEAERRSRHQRNVSIIIVVFFGLLYLSYKFDDDPPFKINKYANPVSQANSSLSVASSRSAALTKFLRAPIDPSEPSTVQVDISWVFPDGQAKAVGIDYWLYPDTGRRKNPYHLGMIPVLTSEHNSVPLPNGLPPGDYLFMGRLLVNGVITQTRSFRIEVR